MKLDFNKRLIQPSMGTTYLFFLHVKQMSGKMFSNKAERVYLQLLYLGKNDIVKVVDGKNPCKLLRRVVVIFGQILLWHP